MKKRAVVEIVVIGAVEEHCWFRMERFFAFRIAVAIGKTCLYFV